MGFKFVPQKNHYMAQILGHELHDCRIYKCQGSLSYKALVLNPSYYIFITVRLKVICSQK